MLDLLQLMNGMMEAFSEPQTSGFMRIVYDTFLVVVATTKHLFSAGKWNDIKRGNKGTGEATHKYLSLNKLSLIKQISQT